MAKISTLTDSFPGTTLNAANWYVEPDAGSGQPSGVISVSGGQLSLNGGDYADTGYYTSVNSQNGYDLTGSAAFVRIVPNTGNSDYDTGFDVVNAAINSGYATGVTGGNLYVQSNSNGSFTTLHTVTYNATSMAWLRIREASGTIYFETAPSASGTWTTQYSTTTETVGSWTASTSYVQMYYGSASGSAKPSGTGGFQDFNVQPATAAGAGAMLVPPAPFSPMAFRRRGVPSQAPPEITSQDTGSGRDSAVVAPSLSPAAVPGRARPGQAQPGNPGLLPLTAPLVPYALLVPPTPFTPMAFTRQARPSAAPLLVPGGDTGSGSDTGQPEFTDTDTGTGADSGTVTATVSGTDTGTSTDTGTAGPLPGTGLAGTPPGFASPMAFRFQRWPTQAPPETAGADSGTGTESVVTLAVLAGDTGTAADTAQRVPVTGTGIVWRLNPVREAMTGLDVILHMASALGAILQFNSHGSERLYVLAQTPGVTLTVTDGGMVLDQAAQPFPPVELQAGSIYCFGPFHSVLAIPGTSTIQVVLSTTYGVQVVVVQGPDAH